MQVAKEKSTAVYIVQHVHATNDDEDVKMIGIYSSLSKAKQAVERAGKLPGFRTTREGFNIDKIILDHDHWESGFVTVRN